MGLDKWLKPEDSSNSSKRKRVSPEDNKKKKNNQVKKKTAEDISPKLMKYKFICQNNKCKYQKIIVKKQLMETDKTCPRCGKEMKIKEG